MKTDVAKQLESTRHAVDLIKTSQRSQHTSIREAMTKMLRCISMLAETEPENLLKSAQKIADAEKEKQDES